MILADVAPPPEPPIDTAIIGLLALIAVATAVILFVRLRKRP